MAVLLFGAETEYAVAGLLGAGVMEGDEAARSLMRAARERLTHLTDLSSSSGIFLANGARLYVDCGTHPEYCTPECTNPWDVVQQVEAGHRTLSGLASAAQGNGAHGARWLAFRSNVDYSTCTTWGTHESYLYKGASNTLRAQLIPHLVTRPIYTGAGGFHPKRRGLEFTLSPRLTCYTKVEGDNSSNDRGIWHTKFEPLSTKYKRLHVVCGESLCSQTALFLKFGVTALVVAMAEAGLKPGAEVRLADPVRAMHAVLGDVSCRTPLAMEDKTARTAIEVQRHYLEMAEAHASDGCMPSWTSEVCRLWREVLDRLETGPEAVARTLDWGIKYALYAAYARTLGVRWESLAALNRALEMESELPGSARGKQINALQESLFEPLPETAQANQSLQEFLQSSGLECSNLKTLKSQRQQMLEIDMRFGQLGKDGIFEALDRAGVLDHRIIAEEEIARAMTEPPGDNRAKIRGVVVQRLAYNDDMRCDWQQIIDFKESKVLDLTDPFSVAENWQPFNDPDAPYHRTHFPHGIIGSGRGQDREPGPLARREQAYDLYRSGDYRGAEDLLRGCVAEGFELASNRCHLARVLMMTDRELEAREEVAQAWAARENAADYVIPRILYFRCLFALIDRSDPSQAIRELKHTLAESGAISSWTILPMLERLHPRLARPAYLFLKALAGVLSGSELLSRMNRFVLWRNVEVEQEAAEDESVPF